MNKSESIFDFLDELRRSGMPEDMISRRMVHFLQEKARESDTPYRGHFELTPLCNLDCKMCYIHLDGDQMRGQRLLEAKEWNNLIQQAVDAGMIRATLSGGECLTYPWFDDVYLFLKKRGVITTVLTNAVLLNEERVRFFKRYRPGKIQVSIYGSSDETYDKVTGRRVFSSVIGNVIAAKEAGLPIKISITPSKYILPDIKRVIKMVKDLDLPYAINMGLMTPRSDTGKNKAEHDISLDDYLDIVRYNRELNNRVSEPTSVKPLENKTDSSYETIGLRCGAGKSTFSINWKGEMNPCTQLVSISDKPLENGFLTSWKAINDKVKHFPRFNACSKCTYSHACDYCAAENEKMGSRFTLDRSWCEKTWKMMESGFRPVPSDSQCD